MATECNHDSHVREWRNQHCVCGEDVYRGHGSLAGMRAALTNRNVSFGQYTKRAELARLLDELEAKASPDKCDA
jgi:hypothetical protein